MLAMVFPALFLIALLAAGCYAVFAPALTLWGLLGVFALGFLGANLLLVLSFFVLAMLQPKLKPGEAVDKQNPLMRLTCGVAARWLCGWAGVRVELRGMEKLPDGPFLFVSNHRSVFDPLVVMAYMYDRNISFVSKPSNLEIPLVGRAARYAGFLAIDRENNREALRTILQAADYLKRGLCNIGIYPEGTRSKTEGMLPFHAGSFKIAQKAGVPVAVACTRGTDRVAKPLFFRRTPVCIEIMELIDAESVKSTNTTVLAEQVRGLIERGLEEN